MNRDDYKRPRLRTVEMAGGQTWHLPGEEDLHSAFKPDVSGYWLEDQVNGARLKVRPQRMKSPGYGRPHVVLFIDAFPAVVDLLSKQEMRVLARVLARVGYGDNFVPICNAEIARELRVAPSRVSEALRKLRQRMILLRAKGKDGVLSRYRVNPFLCWRGQAITYQKSARDAPVPTWAWFDHSHRP